MRGKRAPGPPPLKSYLRNLNSSPIALTPAPAQGTKPFLSFLKVVKAKIIENVIDSGSCCNLFHPLAERPRPLGAPLHVQVTVEEDQVEVTFQVM